MDVPTYLRCCFHIPDHATTYLPTYLGSNNACTRTYSCVLALQRLFVLFLFFL